MYIFQQFMLQLYGCLDLLLLVSDARFYEALNAFYFGKLSQICRSDTWKTIHDNDAFRYIMWRHVLQTMTS